MKKYTKEIKRFTVLKRVPAVFTWTLFNTYDDNPECEIKNKGVKKTYESIHMTFQTDINTTCAAFSSGQKPGPPMAVILVGLLSLAYFAM